MNKTICDKKDCLNYGRYCRIHPSGALKEKKPIAKASKKRDEINKKEYNPAAKEFIKKHPECKVKSPVCSGKSEHVHHLAGRIGDKLTDQRYWVASCDRCNQFIEQNDAWARANGFKLSKFHKEERA